MPKLPAKTSDMPELDPSSLPREGERRVYTFNVHVNVQANVQHTVLAIGTVLVMLLSALGLRG